MGKKHEALTSPTLFYCFLDFAIGTGTSPFTYIVPAPVVAQTLAECHQAWLALPGAKSQPHNDSEFRRFLPDYSHLRMAKYEDGWLAPYREAWGLLQPSG